MDPNDPNNPSYWPPVSPPAWPGNKYPGGGGPPAGNAVLPNETPPAGGVATYPVQPAQPVTYPVGSDVYDWHRINEALRAAGMGDGNWQIAGASHSPINVGQYVKNPEYNPSYTPKDYADEGRAVPPEYIWQEGREWTIGVVNAATGQMFRLKLGRQGDLASGYTFNVLERTPQGDIDRTNPGYKEITRLPFQDGHQELWGTNTATGAFEKMPDQPANMGSDDPAKKGWNDIKQIELPDGSLVWYGTPPEGGQPKPIDGMPVLKAGKYDNIRQVTVNGKKVYMGHNKTTDAFEVIPELGTETEPIPTTTIGGTVYRQNPNAGQPGQPDFIQVTGIATPKDGDEQWVPYGTGQLAKQIYRNGTWGIDPNTPPVDFDPAAARAAGAIKPKGTRYQVLANINGQSRLITVVADGNGGYDLPEDVTAKAVPGVPVDKPVTATSNEQEFISRYNPETGQQENVQNPNWSPAATGDRVRQLRELATAKQRELNAKIGKNGYTAEQADQEFNSWWDTELEPRRQQAQFDQDQEMRKAQTAADQQASTAYTQASNLGQSAVDRYTKMQQSVVTPQFLEQEKSYNQAIAGSGGRGQPPAVDPSAFVHQGYDLNQLHQYYTAQALQHISPTAAGMLGTQPTVPQALQGVDMSGLVRSAFQPSQQPTVNINIGGQPVQGGAPAAPAAPAALAARAPTPIGDINNLFGQFRGPLTG